MKKILLVIKLFLLGLLISSFYLLNKFVDDVNIACLLSMICGGLIYPVSKLSTEPPAGPLTFEGFGKKTPIWAAIILSGLFALIPLSFQPQLSKAYSSYLTLIQGSDFSLFSLEQLWFLFVFGGQLLLGGFGVIVLLFLFQIMSKRVVDYYAG
ncbi:hypothetical protein [Vibrio parahaemolyticus]|uniref:hypothetical protein n=1 Tax=Vibrio parahaemolyticus TaxID=670 RepID=UPI00111F6DB2|nr:hypothetical protein [Vibrio parahaemolyticus]QLE36251.1 hypothetical protein FDV79_11135 [Vibrio parahaemolyticus]